MTAIIPEVSVIIPVFGSAAYIARCVRSLFGQTLHEMEFIFVDDCTPDDSIAIIERILHDEYPQRANQVKIIRHSDNRGVATSRRHGIEAAAGRYIIHCDPDDWTDNDMYATMLAEALRSDADIVICNFVIEHGHRSELSCQRPRSLDRNDIIADICGITPTPLYGSLWNKLIRREIVSPMWFVDGCNYMEDAVFLFTLLLNPGLKTGYCNCAPYHYRQTEGASITTISASRPQIMADLKMISHIHSIATHRDELTLRCIRGLTISLALRAFTAGVFDNEEFKRYYGRYRAYHRILPPKLAIQLPLLRLAMRGHYRLAYNLYLLPRTIYRSLHQ
ncbi:MAG: glycosyltransferase [Candidatus Amulumruptor sp.]|nr:glycosyltransferase [Candidatus Amulumruptor sp.]MDE7238016.1 glycosyltransferase [Paramuribaculum sp.]